MLFGCILLRECQIGYSWTQRLKEQYSGLESTYLRIYLNQFREDSDTGYGKLVSTTGLKDVEDDIWQDFKYSSRVGVDFGYIVNINQGE